MLRPLRAGRNGWFARLLPVLCCLVVPMIARAHDPGLSTADVRLYPDRIEAVLSFAQLDTGELVDLDRNQDHRISSNELAEAAAELGALQPPGIQLTLDGRIISSATPRCEFDAAGNSSVYYTFPATNFSKLALRSQWLAFLPPEHKQFFTLQGFSGEPLAARVLTAASDTVTLQLSAPVASSAAKPASSTALFAAFLTMGMKHVWGGYDHLLFLFGLLIVIRNFSSALKIITCFTVAHSITLAVATSNMVNVPGRFVEPLIAVTIAYVGIENVVCKGNPKHRWLLTFVFGLIHGLGFASVLRGLGMASHGAGFAVPLVSFNLGVELGQIVVAALALPLIWKLRERPRFLAQWAPACSVAIAMFGAFWFVQRVWF
ncbi:MAG TPA: HupE/UreJ family protein [Verrucomicrobiae bacterium]|nr:HupE/UreJ family protein [Verrucomicrobiae bacterium]